jgi:hypothetical protein
MSQESFETIIDDLCAMFKRMKVPVLILYGDRISETAVMVKSRYAANTENMMTLAATAVMSLSLMLEEDYKLDAEKANEMALDAIRDRMNWAVDTKKIIPGGSDT